MRDVVAAADIVEVVQARTPLRRTSGSRFTGRCPFHEERTPSFSVNPVEKLYYCFGCGKGGDIIRFVRETENLDFVGAVEWLADRFRVQLEYDELSPQVEETRKRRERLFALLEQTTSYFERLLWEGETGASVRAYLAERNLGEAVAKEFRLGLSPGRGLADKARDRGFGAEELRAAGLTTGRDGDYFPARLMFPLCDARGRVLGFQARKLREDDPLRGKYVNSPEGDLFHKGSILYGLHLARNAISKQDRAAIVEGNTDVIALRQAGFEPVVASMGTALTEGQLREVGRLTRRLFLCFDADAAGQEATLRGMELASTRGFDVRVVALPRGLDPADSPEGFEDRLSGAESYVVYRVRLELERAPDRQTAFARLLEVFSTLEESPDVQEARGVVGDRLNLPKETLVKAGIDKSVEAVVDFLEKSSKRIPAWDKGGEAMLTNVASISANNDDVIGAMMAQAFGGRVSLNPPVHGKATTIDHDGRTIFRGLSSPLTVGRYHSLIGDCIPEVLEVTATWGDVVMGLRHRTLPVEGVQFHPESILTMEDNHGLRLLGNLLASVAMARVVH